MKILEGQFYPTKKWGHLGVVRYNNARSVDVRFVDTGGLRNTSSANIRSGCVKDYHKPSVFGKGFYGVGNFVSKVKGKSTTEYNRWSGILERCYDQVKQEKQPTYTDCTLTNDWHNFQIFSEWFVNHPYNSADCHVDKDLLIKGNKHYSPETCLIIPHEINEALTLTGASRGDYPVGVSKRTDGRRKPYSAHITKTINCIKRKYGLGHFSTAIEAFMVYKAAKQSYIKSLAEIHREALDPRAFSALMNYTISEED